MPPVTKSCDELLETALLGLLSVVGETGSFPPAHHPFPLSSLAGCEHLEVIFMAVSLELVFSKRAHSRVIHSNFSWGRGGKDAEHSYWVY